ncbi:hypothetical protein ACJX0J_017643, partial [Zea mays]
MKRQITLQMNSTSIMGFSIQPQVGLQCEERSKRQHDQAQGQLEVVGRMYIDQTEESFVWVIIMTTFYWWACIQGNIDSPLIDATKNMSSTQGHILLFSRHQGQATGQHELL